jgi:hypothetical protein
MGRLVQYFFPMTAICFPYVSKHQFVAAPDLSQGDLGGKRLELLKEAVPKVTRVAVLYDPARLLKIRFSLVTCLKRPRTLSLTQTNGTRPISCHPIRLH